MELVERLQRELKIVESLCSICQQNGDRNSRLGLKEVCAFESGAVLAYQYMHQTLSQLLDDILKECGDG